MYKDEILDLYRNPYNEGILEEPDIKQEGQNPSCGDQITIYLNKKDGKISEISHETEACAICTAATSITTEQIKHKTVEEVLDLDEKWILDKMGIDISPMRIKCALLALNTVQTGIKQSS